MRNESDHKAVAAAIASDWSEEALRAALSHAAEWTMDYRRRVEMMPVLPPVAPGDVRSALAHEPPRAPQPFERVLADFDEHVVPGLTHWIIRAFSPIFRAARGRPASWRNS